MITTASTSTAVAPAAHDWHVLVLHDGDEKDILGIWGPYQSDEDARTALQELQNWPINGQWSIFSCKPFPVQPAHAGTTWSQPIQPGITWNQPSVTYDNTGNAMRADWWNGPTS